MFIGTGSIILPGVTIGPNAVVAAGAIVNSDVPEGKRVGGVPAKVIGEFNELVKKRLMYSRQWNGMKREETLRKLWKKKSERNADALTKVYEGQVGK